MDFWSIAMIAVAAIGFLAVASAVAYQVVRRAVRDGLLEASASLGSLSPVGPAIDLPAPQIAWDHPSVVNGTAGLAPVRSISSARAKIAR